MNWGEIRLKQLKQEVDSATGEDLKEITLEAIEIALSITQTMNHAEALANALNEWAAWKSSKQALTQPHVTKALWHEVADVTYAVTGSMPSMPE